MDLACDSFIVFDCLPDPYSTSTISVHFIDPHEQRSIDASFTHMLRLPVVLPPFRRALLSTSDRVHIPHGFVGLLGIRSTWARLGLVSPLTIADPGFYGNLTLEVFNSNQMGILIRTFDVIWNMTLVPAPDEPEYRGRYQAQTGVTYPKALSGLLP